MKIVEIRAFHTAIISSRNLNIKLRITYSLRVFAVPCAKYFSKM
jgi:hypothetical protein